MYDIGLSGWTAVKMGPHPDLIGDSAKAVRAECLHFGVSSHRVEHNFFLGVGRAIPAYRNGVANFGRTISPCCWECHASFVHATGPGTFDKCHSGYPRRGTDRGRKSGPIGSRSTQNR